MNKKGFTLMELLLVVAILAIVAAAAAPTFTSGAGDALKEARKSAFLGAYQNTVTGAHMMVAIAAAKGYDASGTTYLDDSSLLPAPDTDKKLEYYSPKATRQFRNNVGKTYYCSAMVDNNHKLYITYHQSDNGEFSGPGTKIDMYDSTLTSSKVLDDTWTAIENAN